jgi:CRISPR-associated protein Csb1
MSTSLAAQLLQAQGEDRKHTALVVRAVYQPTGGMGNMVMPPTFPPSSDDSDPNRRYLLTQRLLDGQRTEVVVIDQEQSQANRIEENIRNARDVGRVALPMFEMRAMTDAGTIRLTSFDFPHRYADAYLRDSLIDTIPFDQAPAGQRLRAVSSEDVRPLYEREPLSLVFGAWDSHRKGRWPKFARLYTATMFGLEPVLGARRGGRLDPVNLTGAVQAKGSAGNGWEYIAEGEKTKGTRLSEIGHGNIAPNPVPGGVTVKEIRRAASVSLAGLERLRFGDASPEGAAEARAALAALALAGDRLAFGRPSVWLRSGCDLAKYSEQVGLERAGGSLDELEVSAQQALDAFHELRENAAKQGVEMASDVISVTPNAALAKAIAHSVTQSLPEE